MQERFWSIKFIVITITAILVAILIAMCGCGLKAAADCRFADGVAIWATTTTGRPDVVELDANGDPINVGCTYTACYTSQGSPIETEGMPFRFISFTQNYQNPTSGYWFPSQYESCTAPGETDENGMATFGLYRDDWSWRDFNYHRCSIQFGHPTKDIRGTAQAWFQGMKDPYHCETWIPFMGWVQYINGPLYGGYYWSGTVIYNGPVATASMLESPIIALADGEPELPDYGFTPVSVGWVKVKKDGVVKNTPYLAAVMVKDPNKLAIMTPYQFQAIVQCAEPIEANGLTLTGTCKITNPFGPVLTYPMTSTVCSSGGQLTIRSQGVITVEPSCWTGAIPNPFWVNEKLIVPVRLNYFGQPGTRVEYEITGIDKASAASIMSKYWLTDNKTIDINHDGVVNFKDMN